MKRSTVLLLAVAGLAVLAGCSTGTQEVPTEDLTGETNYEWNHTETVHYNVTSSRYEAVHTITNRSHLEVYNYDALGSQIPLDVTALAFRFPNGTVVNATHPNLSASRGGGHTNISMPADQGTLGYTGWRNGKQFSMPVFVEGSYAVTLPRSARVGVPILSRVSPGGYEAAITDDRVTATWSDLSGGSVTLRWYLQLDFLLFGTIVVVGLGLAVGGTAYYVYRIRQLRRRRESVGIDVDQDEDDPRDRGPPPGMG